MKLVRSSEPGLERRLRQAGQLVVFLVALGLIVADAVGLAALSWQALALFSVLVLVVILNDLEEFEVRELGSIQLRDDIDRAKRKVDAIPGPAGGTGEFTADGPLERPAAGTTSEANENAGPDDSSENAGPVDSFDDVIDHARAGRSVIDAGAAASRTGPARDGLEPGGLTAELSRLLENDPRTALVRLRVSLEHARCALADESTEATDSTDADAILEALEDVLGACDEAIHSGERIDREAALRLIELGVRVLEYQYRRTAVEIPTAEPPTRPAAVGESPAEK